MNSNRNRWKLSVLVRRNIFISTYFLERTHKRLACNTLLQVYVNVIKNATVIIKKKRTHNRDYEFLYSKVIENSTSFLEEDEQF
jgi:hypothetical protein